MDPLKDWAREQAVERRATVHKATAVQAASQLAEGFAAHFACGRQSELSGYWPAGDELDIRPLLERLHGSGCAISLPAAAAYGAPVQFRRWTPGDALVAGPYGRLQPQAEAPTTAPSISLVPLLAFDSRCNPLTEGHGLCYQMVSGLQPLSQRGGRLTIGIAFAAQQIDAVPTRVLDQPMNYVVTEAGVMQAPPEHQPAALVLWSTLMMPT